MLNQLNIPQSAGLVVGQYVDSYRLELGENMLSINGDGVVSSDGGDGTITPVSAQNLSVVGDFDFSIVSQEDVGFCFDTVQFSGDVRIQVEPNAEITFVSCNFDKNAKVSFSGGPCVLRFAGCWFGESSTLDCSNVELLEQPEIIECEEETGAGFVLGEVAKEDFSTWKTPLLALAVVGAISGAAAVGKKIKTWKAEERQKHEHEQQVK